MCSVPWKSFFFLFLARNLKRTLSSEYRHISIYHTAYLLLLLKHWQYPHIPKALERRCCQIETWDAELLPTCTAPKALRVLPWCVMEGRRQINPPRPPLISRRQRGLPRPSPRLCTATSARWPPGKTAVSSECQSFCSISCLRALSISTVSAVSWSLIDCRGLNWKCECAYQNV